MSKCADCKFFDIHYPARSPASGDELLKYGRGFCRSSSVLSDHSIDWYHGGTNVDTDASNCLYADCDEQRAALTVGPDFGCIHFDDGATWV